MQDPEVRFRKFLKEKELRFTNERKVILHAVCSIEGHFDVDELYEWLKEQGKELSRATLYRGMSLFVQSGFLKESLRDHGKTHYESTLGSGHHDHLVCLGCGEILEFCDEELETLQDRVCESFGFKPVRHQLEIRGYCRKCRE